MFKRLTQDLFNTCNLRQTFLAWDFHTDGLSTLTAITLCLQEPKASTQYTSISRCYKHNLLKRIVFSVYGRWTENVCYKDSVTVKLPRSKRRLRSSHCTQEKSLKESLVIRTVGYRSMQKDPPALKCWWMITSTQEYRRECVKEGCAKQLIGRK